MTQTDSKETALDVMARIKRNSREREFCLSVLDLWANVQAQGIEIESVDKFGYDPKRLTKADKAKAARARFYVRNGSNPDPFVVRLPNGSHRLTVYNYVRHHDGTTTTLAPMLKAVYEDEQVSQ